MTFFSRTDQDPLKAQGLLPNISSKVTSESSPTLPPSSSVVPTPSDSVLYTPSSVSMTAPPSERPTSTIHDSATQPVLPESAFQSPGFTLPDSCTATSGQSTALAPIASGQSDSPTRAAAASQGPKVPSPEWDRQGDESIPAPRLHDASESVVFGEVSVLPAAGAPRIWSKLSDSTQSLQQHPPHPAAFCYRRWPQLSDSRYQYNTSWACMTSTPGSRVKPLAASHLTSS